MRKNRQYLNEQWNRFAHMVFNRETPDIQRRDMRRAFYAGANCLMHVILKNLSPGSEPTQDDLDMMNELDAELKNFAQLIQQGKV